ncbi:MAG: hypothetical protein ACUVUR_03265 [bacterium]
MIKAFQLIVLSLVFSVMSARANLWYLTRGYDRSDDAWAVSVDSGGRVYWATTEWRPQAAHNDIFLYIVDSTGQQLWRSQPLGDSLNRVAFIAVYKEPYLYIGGRIERSSADLLLLTLRQDQDTFIQEWQYIWDQVGRYEEVDGIGVEDDAIYLSGWTTPSLWNNDIVVQKLDRNGNLVWSNTWGGPGLEGANGHLALDDNNIYLASHRGAVDSSGNAILIAFVRDSGNYLWDSIWDGFHQDDNFYGLAMSSDSFLYCFGYTDTDPSILSQLDLILVKYTRSGRKIWERRWGGPGSEWGRAIVADGDSIVYVCGNTASYGAGATDIVLLKYDSSGELLGYITWGGAYDDIVHDIVKSGDYLYITGTTRNFGAEMDDALLIRANGRTMQFPDTSTGISESNRVYPVRFTVTPNPFISQTVIEFTAGQIPVWLRAYDFTGRPVRKIFISETRSESGRVTWNGRDDSGVPLGPGIYFLRLQAGAVCRTSKVLLLRH